MARTRAAARTHARAQVRLHVVGKDGHVRCCSVALEQRHAQLLRVPQERRGQQAAEPRPLVDVVNEREVLVEERQGAGLEAGGV